MSDPTRRSVREYLGIGTLVTLPVLCCAAPVLLAAGALGALGSWLVNPWLIGAALFGGLAALGWALRQRAAAAAKADCCSPPEPTPSGTPPPMSANPLQPQEH